MTKRLVLQRQTPHQLITIYEDGGDVWMKLNGEIQFHTDESDLSHKHIVVTPLNFSRHINKVLIVGGGDGLPAKEAIRHPIKDLRQVELDGGLVDIVKSHPLMRRVSNDSFNHPKLQLIVGDGIQYVIDANEKFDVIIDDAEFHITGQTDPSPERYNSYLDALYSKLNQGGVISYTIPVDNKGTKNAIKYWMKTIKKRMGPQSFNLSPPYVKYASADLPALGGELYVYISNEPFEKKRDLQ